MREESPGLCSRRGMCATGTTAWGTKPGKPDSSHSPLPGAGFEERCCENPESEAPGSGSFHFPQRGRTAKPLPGPPCGNVGELRACQGTGGLLGPQSGSPPSQTAVTAAQRVWDPAGMWHLRALWRDGQSARVLPSACTAAARFTRWSASSMASAGPRGSSRDSPMTRILISVSSRMGTSEQRRRKKLQVMLGDGW